MARSAFDRRGLVPGRGRGTRERAEAAVMLPSVTHG